MLLSKAINRFLGDRNLYQKIICIAFPIIIQNLVTNFVNMLDNVMVGRLGTDSINAVCIVNQLYFVYVLCLWGSLCGAGIFTAQYFGQKNTDGVRNTFRTKIWLAFLVSVVSIAVLVFKGDYFILKFIHDGGDSGNSLETLRLAKKYLSVMMWGIVPTALSMSYSNTLRDIGLTSLPMKAGLAAVCVNIVFNWLLIFGNLGFPCMGVSGAAVATVLSRLVELSIVLVWTHTHKKECEFIKGAFSSLKVPFKLWTQIVKKGAPLCLNETLWASGLAFLQQSYSVRGLSVVAAMNINSTIWNLFSVILFAIGESISIIVGQLLGADKKEESMSTAKKMICLSTLVCLVIGGIMALCKDVFPMFYNTEADVKELASVIILITSLFMPVIACMNACYFTLRSGGKTIVTFLFDSMFLWVITVPVAFFLTRHTSMGIIQVYLIIKSLDIIKIVIGVRLVRKGVWIQNLVGKKDKSGAD